MTAGLPLAGMMQRGWWRLRRPPSGRRISTGVSISGFPRPAFQLSQKAGPLWPEFTLSARAPRPAHMIWEDIHHLAPWGLVSESANALHELPSV